MDESRKNAGAALPDEALDKVAGGGSGWDFDNMEIGGWECPKCHNRDEIAHMGYGPNNTQVVECGECENRWLIPF